MRSEISEIEKERPRTAMPADEGQRGLGLHIDPKARIVDEHGSAGERPARQIERRGVVAVRAAEQRASRLVRDGETEDPQSNQYVRDKMREESFVIEQISLIGTGPVVQAAKKVDELLRAALEPPVTSNVGISIMTAQSNFLGAVRKELEIKN